MTMEGVLRAALTTNSTGDEVVTETGVTEPSFTVAQ
jgi:hypothetical protein